MPITQSQSYSSNFGNDFTNTLNIASVAAVAGDAILASYTFRATDPQIAAAPTWNGQTLSLVHTSSDTSKTVYIYGVVASASATATLTAAPTNWTYAAALVKVATGNIAPTSTFITPVVKFEDSTNTPWSSPSNSVTGVATGDILVDFLFASDQDSGGNDLTGQVFTPGAGQTNGLSINNSASHYVGNISSSIKSGATGTVSTSYSANLQPVYIYIATGIRAAVPAATINNMNSGAGVVSGSSGNTITVSGLGSLTGLTLKDAANNTLTISSFASQGGGIYTFSVPAIAAGSVGIMLGNVTATATDGTLTTSGFGTTYSLTGFTGVVAESLDSGAIGSSWTPALAVGDMVAIDSTGSITTGMVYTSSTSGTHPGWHYSNADKTWRSFNFVNSIAAAIATVVGQAMSFVSGIASAVGSAVAIPAGNTYSFTSGAPAAKGGALIAVIGQVYSFLGGAQGQAAASSTAISNEDVRKVNYANLISRKFGLGAIIADLQQRVTALENK